MLYNGWTPSTADIERMQERRLQSDFRHKLLTLTTEAEADRLHELIYDAEVMEILVDQVDAKRWQNEPDFEDEPKEVQPKVDFTKIDPIEF